MAFKLKSDNVEHLAQAGHGEQQTVSNQDIMSDLRNQLREALEIQRKVAKARERVLIQREKVRASAQKIREKRAIAGDVEAAFMNTLRENSNQSSATVSSIAKDYVEVETARNELGVLEADHVQAESTLTGVEWNFLAMENELYQLDLQEILSQLIKVYTPTAVSLTHIPPPPPPPPPPPNFIPYFPPLSSQHPFPPPPPSPPALSLPIWHQSPPVNREHEAAVAELDELRKEFDSLRHEQARRIEARIDDPVSEDGELLEDPSPSEFTTEYLDILERIADREVETKRLKEDALQHEIQESAIRRRNSDSNCTTNHPPTATYPLTRALTESAIPILAGDPSVRQRIQDWLLIDLKENVVHRNLYLNTLLKFGIEASAEGLLEDWAARNWEADSSGDNIQDEPEQLLTEAGSSSHTDNSEYEKGVPINSFGQTGVDGDEARPATVSKSQVEHNELKHTPSPPAPDLIFETPTDLERSAIHKGFESPLDPKMAVRADSHHGSEVLNSQVSPTSKENSFPRESLPTCNIEVDTLCPHDTAGETGAGPRADVPIITVTEPHTVPNIDEMDAATPKTPPKDALPTSNGNTRKNEDVDTLTQSCYDAPWIRKIRVDAISIARPLSVRSEQRSPRPRFRDSLFKKRGRSVSAGATLTAHDSVYTCEHRQ